jgi:hypothetical protein
MNIQMSKETINLTKAKGKQDARKLGWASAWACFRKKSGLEKEEENMKYNKASLPKMETSIPRCCN